MCRVTGRRDTVLLVRDKGGGVFGAFLPAEWKHKANDFYGTGECFVFQLCPSLAKYTWTGANSMFISSNMSGVVIGGGGKAAIWLDSEFNNGGSGPCSTFDSPCLGSSDLFTCLHLEVCSSGLMTPVPFFAVPLSMRRLGASRELMARVGWG